MSTTTHVATLAVNGGDAVRREAFPVWPTFDEGDVAAAGDVIRSGLVNYWTGDQGRRFEEEFATWAGVPHAVAMANGTLALEAGIRALGIAPGDDVIVPASTFIATASAVVACGGRPVVADVDQNSRCLSLATVEQRLTPATRGVIAVHLAGFPADLEPIRQRCDQLGLWLLEDCAQAHGARRDGRSVGTTGDLAAWSFCQDKIFTTGGEGGAVTTRDAELWRRCWEYKDHGKDYVESTAPPSPGFRWVHHSFGTNARMSEVHAAVGRRQLRRVPNYVQRRRDIASALITGLGDVPGVLLPVAPPGVEASFYRFLVRIAPGELDAAWGRDRIVAALKAEGIPSTVGGCGEIQRERAFREFDDEPVDTPVAEMLAAHSLTLPVHPAMSRTDVDDVIAATRKVMGAASR
ncbi:DegT/DnrJ/EryC1/StrS family aminotransferase [Actinomycetospora sp. C-140]